MKQYLYPTVIERNIRYDRSDEILKATNITIHGLFVNFKVDGMKQSMYIDTFNKVCNNAGTIGIATLHQIYDEDHNVIGDNYAFLMPDNTFVYMQIGETFSEFETRAFNSIHKNNYMKAITLHDKFSEEIIGTVLLKENTDFAAITNAWDLYQTTHNSNTDDEPDIHEFVALGNTDKCEVLEIDFYQPSSSN